MSGSAVTQTLGEQVVEELRQTERMLAELEAASLAIRDRLARAIGKILVERGDTSCQR